VEIILNNATDSTPSRIGFVELPNSTEGAVVGSLAVPPDLSNELNTTLTVAYVIAEPAQFPDQLLASTILNITLVNAEGQSITQLDTPLTICLSPPNDTKKNENLCLSYYDELKSKWRCEDRCLSSIRKDSQLCGQTGHLTNFALLITGRTEDPCGGPKPSNTLSWVSLGFVAGAILLVLLGVILVELKIRIRSRKEEGFFHKIAMPVL
jgi:hypothetical protein